LKGKTFFKRYDFKTQILSKIFKPVMEMAHTVLHRFDFRRTGNDANCKWGRMLSGYFPEILQVEWHIWWEVLGCLTGSALYKVRTVTYLYNMAE